MLSVRRFYVGLNVGHKQPKNQAARAVALFSAACPDGFTVLKGEGHWRGQVEDVLVFVVASGGGVLTDDVVGDICFELQQDCIAVEENNQMSFVNGMGVRS